MKKREYLIILIIVLLTGALYLNNRITREETSVSVYKGKDLLKSFDINEDNSYSFEGDYGHFNVEVKDGRVRAYDVECPNQICVHTGWISLDNPVPIICLPNNIVVKIDEE